MKVAVKIIVAKLNQSWKIGKKFAELMREMRLAKGKVGRVNR